MKRSKTMMVISSLLLGALLLFHSSRTFDQTLTPFNPGLPGIQTSSLIDNQRGTIGFYNRTISRLGAGCPISPTTIMTAAHVWLGGETDTYIFDGPQVQAISVDAEKDIAILTFAELDKGYKFARWFPLQKKLKEGDNIHIPLFDSGTFRGYFLWQDEDELFFDAVVFPGMSGSCILNDKDEVVAIVTELKVHPHPGVRSLLVGKRGR